MSDVINLLGANVVMLLRARAGCQPRFSQALVADDRITMREQFANFPAVLRKKGKHGLEICNIHIAKGFLEGSEFLFGQTRLAKNRSKGSGRDITWVHRNVRLTAVRMA